MRGLRSAPIVVVLLAGCLVLVFVIALTGRPGGGNTPGALDSALSTATKIVVVPPPTPTPWLPDFTPPPPIISTATILNITNTIDLSPTLPVDQKVVLVVRRADGTYIRLLVSPSLSPSQVPLQPGDEVVQVSSPAASFGKYAPMPTPAP